MNRDISRRGFLAGAAAVAGAYTVRPAAALHGPERPPIIQPRSTIRGVKLGIIAPYSFRNEVNTAEEVLQRLVELGLTWVEMQSFAIEQFAGVPASAASAGMPGARWTPGASAEERDAREAAARELRDWRLSTPMDKFRELRRMYEGAGVRIDIVKFPTLGPAMTDDELEWAFEMARAVGASAVTAEPPVSDTKRIGQVASRQRMMIGFHGHADVANVEAFARPGSWEQAFFYSPFNGANLDIGHFVAGNRTSPIPFIREYAHRITSIHVKDRKIEGGAVPFGEGDTPVREVLRLMRDERYPFQATLEMEYPVPPGSSVMAELEKCVRYCRDALES